MSSLTYTGVYPTIVSATTTGGGGRAYQAVPGSTRWNQTTGMMEMYDGYQWQAITQGEVKNATLADEVECAEDRIIGMIEEEYADNVTIQDAFKAWQEANEQFRVILAIAEKK